MAVVKVIVRDKHDADNVNCVFIKSPCVSIQVNTVTGRFKFNVANGVTSFTVLDIINIDGNLGVAEYLMNTMLDDIDGVFTLCFDGIQEKLFIIDGAINIGTFLNVAPIIDSGIYNSSELMEVNRKASENRDNKGGEQESGRPET